MFDSSPDRMSRNVVNTIANCGLTGERLLLDTRFLDSVDNVSLFHVIDDVRKEYSIQWQQIENIVCDSASYNKKLYNTIKESINPRVRLMRCWAHQLDLVSDTWQDSPLNNNVHVVIAKFQHLMNKSSTRKARYLQHLKDQRVSNPRFMPSVVLSRWNTWFSAVEYLDEFLDCIHGYIRTEKRDQEDSELVNALYTLLQNPSDLAEVRLMARFNAERAIVFYNIIKDFETSLGITHVAYNKIYGLWNHLRFNMYNRDFGEELTEIMTNGNLEVDWWNLELENLYKKAWNKLDRLMKEHEALDFLKSVRVFDPTQLPYLSKDVQSYAKSFPELNDVNGESLTKEFKTYLKANTVIRANQGLIAFWKEMATSFPNLSKLAAKSLNTPTSSVDVERSFSMYRDILSHKRCRLKEASIEALSMLNYNTNFNEYDNTL